MATAAKNLIKRSFNEFKRGAVSVESEIPTEKAEKFFAYYERDPITGGVRKIGGVIFDESRADALEKKRNYHLNAAREKAYRIDKKEALAEGLEWDSEVESQNDRYRTRDWQDENDTDIEYGSEWDERPRLPNPSWCYDEITGRPRKLRCIDNCRRRGSWKDRQLKRLERMERWEGIVRREKEVAEGTEGRSEHTLSLAHDIRFVKRRIVNQKYEMEIEARLEEESSSSECLEEETIKEEPKEETTRKKRKRR